ncbi:MAG: histidine phosphatase family protein, partial [Bacteroides sp.]|nr:histidine phosphatase family protein [Bacteroides sp.]
MKISILPNEAFCRLRRACVLLVIVLLGATDSNAGLKIYYIRHAEAGHNVAVEWAIVPRDQWPDFVGDPNMFTPKGEKQRMSAIRKLKRYDFDFIAVSPMWRCWNTVLPFLK